MARKKKISEESIISYYMEYVLTNNNNPISVYSFSKEYNFNEEDFYKLFGSFELLEQSIFNIFFKKTINLLKDSNDYLSYGARNQILSFYYSFFELLTVNRSYVVYALGPNKNNLNKLKTLKLLKHSFTNYVKELDITLIEVKLDSINNLQNTTLKESAWIQFLLTIKFWLEDSSPSFEKTDIFIEKAVNTSFDIMDIKPINSIIDLGKFLYKEKSFMN